MDTKHKNVLIGGLLAIVFVMAVGYAAFATQLNINGTATITSSWNVHFDATKTTDDIVAGTAGLTGATAPTGTVTFTDSNLTANLTADLKQPGDKVVYTLTILNKGSLDAKASTPALTLNGGTVNGLVATKGHIKFTVTEPNPNLLVKDTGSATMTVTAEYINDMNEDGTEGTTTGNTTTTEEATLNVTLTYTQPDAESSTD